MNIKEAKKLYEQKGKEAYNDYVSKYEKSKVDIVTNIDKDIVNSIEICGRSFTQVFHNSSGLDDVYKILKISQFSNFLEDFEKFLIKDLMNHYKSQGFKVGKVKNTRNGFYISWK